MLENREFREQIKMDLFDRLNTHRTKANLQQLHYDYFLEASIVRHLNGNGINVTSNKYEFIQAIGVYPYTNQMEFDVLLFKSDIDSFSDGLGQFLQKNSVSVFNQNFNVLAIELLTDFSVVDNVKLTLVIVILNNPLYIKEIGADIDNLKIYGVCLKEGSSLSYIEIENMSDDGTLYSECNPKMKVTTEHISFNPNDHSFYAKVPRYLLKEHHLCTETIKLGFYLKKSNEYYTGNKYGLNIDKKLKIQDKSYLVFEIAFDFKSKCLKNRFSFGLDYSPEIKNCRFFLNTPKRIDDENTRKSRSAHKPVCKTANKQYNKLDISNHILQMSAGIDFKPERTKKLYYFCEKVHLSRYVYISKLKSVSTFRKHLDDKYLDNIESDLKTLFENKTLNNFFGNTIKHLETTDVNLSGNDSGVTAFKNYYQSNELSDLAFEGSDKIERKSHKLVMLSVSPFFARLLKYSQNIATYKNLFDFNKISDKELKDMQSDTFQIGYRVDKIIIPSWLSIQSFDMFLKFCYHRTLDINSVQKIDDFISLIKFSLITSTTDFLKLLILRFLQRFDIFALDQSYVLTLLKFLLNDSLEITSSIGYYLIMILACIVRLLQLPKDFLNNNQTMLLSLRSTYIEDILVMNRLLRRDEIDEILLKALMIKQQRSGFSELILNVRQIEKLNNITVTNKERFKIDNFIQLFRESKEGRQYIEIDLVESGIHIAVEESVNKLLYDNISNQVKSSLLEKSLSDDNVLKICINNIKKGSLVIGNIIDVLNVKFYTLLYIDQTERLSIFFLKDKSNAVDNDICFSIDLHISNGNKEVNQNISLLAKLSYAYIIGAETNLDIKEKGMIEIEIVIKEAPLYSILLDYIATNFDNVEFTIKNRDSLANIDFIIEPLKLQSDDILSLDYMDLFYIFRNRNLFLRDEKTLLIFTVLYIDKNKQKIQKRDLETLLMSIKFEYIDFELLLKLVRDNKILSDVEAFKSVLIRKLRNQEQLSSPRKFYKVKRKDGTVDLYERLIEWVVNEDHHETCNFHIKQQAETIEELTCQLEQKDRKLNNMTKELQSYKKKCEVLEHSTKKRTRPYNSDHSISIHKGYMGRFCAIF